MIFPPTPSVLAALPHDTALCAAVPDVVKLAEVPVNPDDVHWLPGDRYQDLKSALRTDTWHVLHCVCHGGFGDTEGYIQLTGDDGLDYPFKAHSLVGVAFGSLHPGLGVVFTPAVSSGERQALTVRVPTK